MRSRIENSAGWLFGLSVTILLLSIWGRAIVVDDEALGDALLPLATSAAVVDQVADWLEDELVADGVDPLLAKQAVARSMSTTVVGGVVEKLVLDVVGAAAGVDGVATVDVAGVLAPTVPQITRELTAVGAPISEEEVRAIVTSLDPLMIRQPGEAPVVGPDSVVASRLGTATIIAAIMAIFTGWVSVRASPDRNAAVRKLLTRVALGGLSFGVMLRIGGWILDPAGGKAPVTESISELANSKWLIPMSFAAISAGMASVFWLLHRVVRREAAFR